MSAAEAASSPRRVEIAVAIVEDKGKFLIGLRPEVEEVAAVHARLITNLRAIEVRAVL